MSRVTIHNEAPAEEEIPELPCPQDTNPQINQANKFDIKHLKQEIWRIIHDQLPEYGQEEYYTFLNLLVTLRQQMSAELLESLSVHQTFLCILHLANAEGMRLVAPAEGETDFAMFLEAKPELLSVKKKEEDS